RHQQWLARRHPSHLGDGARARKEATRRGAVHAPGRDDARSDAGPANHGPAQDAGGDRRTVVREEGGESGRDAGEHDYWPTTREPTVLNELVPEPVAVARKEKFP